MIADEVDAISAEVRVASEAFEIVITAGGVGPTRDDLTMAGVAEALGKPLMRCVCVSPSPPLLQQGSGQACADISSDQLSALEKCVCPVKASLFSSIQKLVMKRCSQSSSRHSMGLQASCPAHPYSLLALVLSMSVSAWSCLYNKS